MQVQVHEVHSDVPHADDSHHSIHVGPVHIDQPTLGVNNLGNGLDVLLEQTQGIGVGNHDARRVFIHDRLNSLRRQDPLFIGRNGNRGEPAEGTTRRVGSVGRVGDKDLVPGGTSVVVISSNDHHPGKLSVGPRRRLERRGG